MEAGLHRGGGAAVIFAAPITAGTVLRLFLNHCLCSVPPFITEPCVQDLHWCLPIGAVTTQKAPHPRSSHLSPVTHDPSMASFDMEQNLHPTTPGVRGCNVDDSFASPRHCPPTSAPWVLVLCRWRRRCSRCCGSELGASTTVRLPVHSSQQAGRAGVGARQLRSSPGGWVPENCLGDEQGSRASAADAARNTLCSWARLAGNPPPSPATFRCTSPEMRRPAAAITPLLGCDAFTTGPCAGLQELRRCITGAAAGEPALLLLPAAVLSRRSRSPKEGDDEYRPGRRSAAPTLLLMGS